LTARSYCLLKVALSMNRASLSERKPRRRRVRTRSGSDGIIAQVALRSGRYRSPFWHSDARDLKSSDIHNYFAARTPDVHMRWNMVLRVNHHCKSTSSEHRRHDWNIREWFPISLPKPLQSPLCSTARPTKGLVTPRPPINDLTPPRACVLSSWCWGCWAGLMAIDKGCDYLSDVFWSLDVFPSVFGMSHAPGWRERWLRGRDERTGERMDFLLKGQRRRVP